MPDMDALALAEQAVLLGLVTPGQAREAVNDAEDGSLDALRGSLLRKGLLTSWQLDRLQKGDPTGFFFGGCKVLFHLAEGTFARVYRGERRTTGEPGRHQGPPPAVRHRPRRRRTGSTRRPRRG